MPITYHMEPETGLLVARASGTLNDAEVRDRFRDIVEATGGAALLASHLFLADEATSLHEFDMAAMRRIRAAIEDLGRTYPGRDVRTAFVLPGGAGQHLTILMWKTLTELHTTVGTRVRVFTDEASARAWLKEKQTETRRAGAV